MTAEVAREVLGLQLRVGDHICGFYRKPADARNSLIPFRVQGLRARSGMRGGQRATARATPARPACPSTSRSTPT